MYEASTNKDYDFFVVQTSDGGYAIAGTEDVSYGSSSRPNFLLIKIDSSGNMQWKQNYGGKNYVYARAFTQTNDGGYAIAGKISDTALGLTDFLLVKVNSAGNMIWNKTYDGYLDDIPYDMIQTSDGGYALLGSAHPSWYYIWLIKTDSSGNMAWNETYGEEGDNFGNSLIQTDDGGLLIGGRVGSQLGENGSSWVAKTDASGNLLWSKKYGGNTITSVVKASNGGYLVTGILGEQSGQDDVTVIKADTSGNILWCKTQWPYNVIQTRDGGYAFGAYSLIKTDANGKTQWYNDFMSEEIQWSSNYAGAEIDVESNIVDANGNIIVKNGDWIIVGDDMTIEDTQGNIYGKYIDMGEFQFEDLIGTMYIDSLVETNDGGYALTGFAPNGPGIFLIKTDAVGVVPEFPALIVIPMLTLLTAIALLVNKKHIQKTIMQHPN